MEKQDPSFMEKRDQYAKSNPFFAIWRVYMQVINVKRIQEDCGVTPLSCHFMLTLTPDKY